MNFRFGHLIQCQTIYHAKIPYQPKNYFSTIKNTRYTAFPVLEILDAPYCTSFDRIKDRLYLDFTTKDQSEKVAFFFGPLRGLIASAGDALVLTSYNCLTSVRRQTRPGASYSVEGRPEAGGKGDGGWGQDCAGAGKNQEERGKLDRSLVTNSQIIANFKMVERLSAVSFDGRQSVKL